MLLKHAYMLSFLLMLFDFFTEVRYYLVASRKKHNSITLYEWCKASLHAICKRQITFQLFFSGKIIVWNNNITFFINKNELWCKGQEINFWTTSLETTILCDSYIYCITPSKECIVTTLHLVRNVLLLHYT